MKDMKDLKKIATAKDKAKAAMKQTSKMRTETVKKLADKVSTKAAEKQAAMGQDKKNVKLVKKVVGEETTRTALLARQKADRRS